MAFRLNEIIGPQTIYQECVKDSNKLMLPRSTQSWEHPIVKTNQLSYPTSKKIIFEYKQNYGFDLIYLCAKGPEIYERGLSTTNILGFYRLGIDNRLFGYTTGSVATVSHPAGYTIGLIYHVLLDFSVNELRVYETKSKSLAYKLNFSGFLTKLSNGFTLGFSSGSSDSDVSEHPVINPDVESFLVQPFVEYDEDLCAEVNANKILRQKNSILSIL